MVSSGRAKASPVAADILMWLCWLTLKLSWKCSDAFMTPLKSTLQSSPITVMMRRKSDKSSDWTTDSNKCLLIVCNGPILSISGFWASNTLSSSLGPKPPRSTNHRSVLVGICFTSTFSWFPKAAGNAMCRQWLNLTGLHERDPAAELKRVSKDVGEGRDGGVCLG